MLSGPCHAPANWITCISLIAPRAVDPVPPCWLLSPSANSGGGSAVVMVKAVEDGAHQDATGELWRARNGLLLADALVWPCLIVEDDERGEQAPEVLVAKHEDVVEQLPPERAHEALSEGVHVRLAYGAADDLRSGGLED